MSFWSAVVIIVAIIAITNLRMAKYRARGLHGAHPGRFIDAGPIGPSPRELELQREVESLRERVNVLERIATDGRKTQALAAEIESLRDN